MAKLIDLCCTSFQDKAGNKTKLGNLHLELSTEEETYIKERQKHLETGKKSEVTRGADQASTNNTPTVT